MSFRVTPELYALVLIGPNLLALLLKREWGGVYFVLFKGNAWCCPLKSAAPFQHSKKHLNRQVKQFIVIRTTGSKSTQWTDVWKYPVTG